MAERVGFEPTVPCGTPDFESDARCLRSARHLWQNLRAMRRMRRFCALVGRNPPTSHHEQLGLDLWIFTGLVACGIFK